MRRSGESDIKLSIQWQKVVLVLLQELIGSLKIPEKVAEKL